MPKVTFVKSARKANPRYGIEVGDSYYHWAFMVGGRGGPKICSKTKPTRSQLTNSDFLQGLYGIFDDDLAGIETAINDTANTPDWSSIPDDIEAIAERLRELGQEQRDKFENMPEGLQQGDTGQMLEQRADGCESAADEVETAASDLRQKLEELDSEQEEYDAAVEAWKAYDEEYSAWEAADDGSDEPTEPDSERPDPDRDFDDERREACGEATSAAMETEGQCEG